MAPEIVENLESTARDHLANERTFLAWVRTALGLVGLGVLLERLGAGSDQDIAVAAGVADFVVCYRALNARSEFRSAFSIDPRTNRLLVLGTVGAVAGHLLVSQYWALVLLRALLGAAEAVTFVAPACTSAWAPPRCT